MRSADGRTWERGRRVVAAESRWLVQDGRVLHGPGDVTIFSPDPSRGRHLALLKFFSPRPVEHRSRLRSRAFMWVEHLDDAIDLDRLERVDLVPPAAEVDGDRPHDEYYASTAWRYGEMWLGGLKIWHRDGDYPHSAAGCAFLKLASSRDGLCWEKVPFAGEDGVPEVWIPNGEEGGGGGRDTRHVPRRWGLRAPRGQAARAGGSRPAALRGRAGRPALLVHRGLRVSGGKRPRLRGR